MNVRSLALSARVSVLVVVVAGLHGCQQTDEPESSFYEERIEPTLTGSCARGPAGGACHLPVEDGIALGNLDMSSFDALMRRDDVLVNYGPYNVPLLLLKGGEQIDVQVETFDPDNPFVTVRTQIQHNAGNNIARGSQAYAQLQQWTEAGFQRNGVPDETLATNLGECRRGPGSNPLYDPGFADAYPAAFQRFRDEVQPVLTETCAGSSCHGSTIADLYLSCGESDEELRWNFWVSVAHLTTPASTSGLLRRPLSTFRGGVFHEGGNVFASAEDEDYAVLRDWAESVVDESPEALAPPADISEGFRFFVNRVQPALVREGCMFLNCHSPSLFHDLRLQGGAEGHFSRVAMWRNYEASRHQLAMDASDPNESRIIAKNLFPADRVAGASGITHRGGPLFEDFGLDAGGAFNPATPDDCAGFDADDGDLNEVPAYCILVRWHEIERMEDADVTMNPLSGIVWVSRPTGVGDPRDFDTYRPGADLLFAATGEDADGALTPLGAGTSLLAGCGIDPSVADVRGPAVSWDGERVAFAARSSASEPLRLYEVGVDGMGCAPIDGANSDGAEGNGVPIHDFDPAYAPDGRLVFASTRGNADPEILGVAGPTLTPAELQPNANLYIYDPDGGGVRQLTYLLNQEIQPSFMSDGRVIFTAEKRSVEFHQLAGRRLNLDGGDYHPLFAQRDSVGYASATEFVELLDRNLALVAAPIDAADGAGTIVIVNRSIGPDQDDRPADDRYYLPSQSFPMGGGVFRSPAGLPSGNVLVACDLGASDPTVGGYDFELCELDPDSGAVSRVGGVPGMADVEAVPVFARGHREVFVSRVDEANGSTRVEPGATDATVEIVDFPLLATLLFRNTREGRPIDPNIEGFNVYAEYPPMPGDTPNTSDAFGDFYRRRERLGSVGLNADGSAAIRFRGGLPIVLEPTSGGEPLTFADGGPFTGEMIQREQMQFYPGERSHQSFPRALFNGLCGGCHGSISGRELDVAADVDVLTTASMVESNDQTPTDLGPGL
jgi:hypothetical protein